MRLEYGFKNIWNFIRDYHFDLFRGITTSGMTIRKIRHSKLSQQMHSEEICEGGGRRLIITADKIIERYYRLDFRDNRMLNVFSA